MSFPPPPPRPSSAGAHPRTSPVDSGGTSGPPPPSAGTVEGPPVRTVASKPSRGIGWGTRAGLCAGVLVAALGSAAFAHARFLPGGVVLPGLAIAGERVPDGADEAKVRAIIDARAQQVLGQRVKLTAPKDEKAEPRVILEGTLGELGVVVDTDATLAVAKQLGRSGDVLTRAEAAKRARAGGLDVPLTVRLERKVALPRIETLKETEDTMPVSARLDLDKHQTIPEREGRYIDSDATLARIDAIAHQGASGTAGETTFEVPTAKFAPRISSKFLESLDISTVVAEYDTFFSRGGDQKLRGRNIDNASQKLDGLVLPPGELISFNTVVGERSEANGFYKSWEIFKGEMVEGMGGGTCQVASTFHAAAFFAGLEVLERLPHSRPSAYIPMGLDSTVVYPGVDLKVRNPHPFPVVVHAKTEGGKLHVELLGKMRPVQVAFGRDVLETLPYKRKIIEDATLSGKKVLVKQHGIRGYRVKRSRLFTYPDGTKKKEDATDTYPPTTEIYHVPVGFDIALLPKLPGEAGEDTDLGGNPSAAPAQAKTPSSTTGSTTASATDPDAVQFVDAPGAHAPTSAQKDAAKSMWLKR